MKISPATTSYSPGSMTPGYETIPYLRALGEFGRWQVTLPQHHRPHLLSPHAFGGGDSEATIYYTLETFKGTMIIDESDFRDSDESALISKIINIEIIAAAPSSGSKPSPAATATKSAASMSSGPKIFGAREGFGDQASDSRCLTHYTTSIVLRPDIPIDLDATF